MPTTTILVPHGATGWRYLEIDRHDDTDYSAPGFDDSGWALGQTTFADAASTHATLWDIDTRLWVRRSVLVAEAGLVTVEGYIDNTIFIYWDGVEVHEEATDGAAYTVTFPATVGTHVLAIQATDDAPTTPDGAVLRVQVSLEVASGWTLGKVGI